MASRDGTRFVNKINSNEFSKYLEFDILGVNSFVSKLTYSVLNVFMKSTRSLFDYNIFSWVIISAIIWTILYVVYNQCIKLLIRRIGVDYQDRKTLVLTVWRLCFTLMSIPMIMTCISGNALQILYFSGSWEKRLDLELSVCKIHKEPDIPGIKTLYVLHSSFLLHQLATTWFFRGFKNFEFFQTQFCLAIFILTFYSKCPVLGLSILFLLHCADLVNLLSKLSCLISHFTSSSVLRRVSCGLCGYHQLLWCFNFFYNFPKFLLTNKTIDSGMMNAELKMLIVLDFMMWLFVAASLYSSVFSRIMLSLVRSNKQHPIKLEYFLFGNISSSRSQIRSDPRGRKTVTFRGEDLDDEEYKRRRMNSEALLQTVRCSILVKRKVKRMREKKLLEQSQGESSQG